eukprot:gene14747-17425_t
MSHFATKEYSRRCDKNNQPRDKFYPLPRAHSAALASLDILDKQLTNLRSVSQLAACTESASKWTVGMPSLPGADAEWVRSTDSASRSARIRFADAKAHFASYFAVSKMVNAAVDHLAEGEVDACLEVLQLVDNESTLGTTRSIEMARTLAISQTHEFGFQVA